jgi:alkylhydroperoxidase family enzyme
VSRTKGLTDEEIASVPQFRASSLFTEREKAALEYADEMTKTPLAVPDELFARLRQFFNEDQLVELTSSIAYENYRARFYHALDIGSDGLYVCALPARPQAAAGAAEHG